MSSSFKKKSGFLSMLQLVFGLLLLLVIVGGIMYASNLTNGFTGSVKTFYVQQGDEKIYEGVPRTLELAVGDTAFTVGFSYDKIAQSPVEKYTVNVLPVDDNDFSFCVDGNIAYFSDFVDYTKAFNVKYSGKSFTLSLPDKYGMDKILRSMYKDEIVTDIAYYDTMSASLFKLVISSGSNVIEIPIVFKSYKAVERIEFDKEAIYI